jgi:HK97 family phage prohead protease
MYIKNLQCQILRDGVQRDGAISFVASTANADRYGDVINQAGWSLDKFRANPVILLNHNANSLPIGKGEVDVIDGRLMVDVEFDMDDPQAAEVARKTKAGFLNAVSVGFNPIDATPRSMLEKNHPAYGQTGQFFDRAELLEISIVTIPANGDAVAAKGYDMQNRTFKLSNLKHIIDVEMRDDVVVVTYAREDMPESDSMDQDEEPMDEELAAYNDDEEKEDKAHHDMQDDEEKEKDFLTPQERAFLHSLLNGAKYE